MQFACCSKDLTRVPSTGTPCPDGVGSTTGDTLPDLDSPQDSTAGVSAEESTEETTLLSGGGPEVSGGDVISREEDHLLANTLQEPAKDIPADMGGSTPVLGPSTSKLMGGPPVRSTDHPEAGPPESSSSGSAIGLAPTLEHQAEVHSDAPNAGTEAAAMSALRGQPFIKKELKDPDPVTFMGDLGAVDKDLEIVDFVPAHEVAYTDRRVKEEWSDETSQCRRKNASLPFVSDCPVTPHPISGCNQPSTSDRPVTLVITSAAMALMTSTPSQGLTTASAAQETTRCAMQTTASGMGPCLVSAFQLSTISPPIKGLILYVCT